MTIPYLIMVFEKCSPILKYFPAPSILTPRQLYPLHSAQEVAAVAAALAEAEEEARRPEHP